MTDKPADRPTFLPLPDGVSEETGTPVNGGIVARRDGSLLMVHTDGKAASGLARRLSSDKGANWTPPEPLLDKHMNGAQGCGVIQLQSGDLALYHGTLAGGWYLSTSADEGETWSLALRGAVHGGSPGRKHWLLSDLLLGRRRQDLGAEPGGADTGDLRLVR